MSDLIDRQAVLDTIHRFFTEEVDKIPTKKTEDGEVIIICKAQPLFAMNKTLSRRIKELPSVNPQEPKYCDRNICVSNEYNGIGCDECEVTKSQEPKTGHWIDHQEDRWIYAKCSECGTVHDTRTNYCPNCGCRMVEPQESEDKHISGKENE